MMACVAVDQQARPLRSAIIWADQRAMEESRRLATAVGWEEAYHITGHRLSPSYSGPKILWVRAHQPEIFAATVKFLQPKDFIVARLTGRFVTDYSDASGTNLYDLAAWDWSDRILDAAGLGRAILPELHASTDVVGEVLAPADEETGLAPGTPVVIGGGDGPCASVGAGVVRAGSAYNYLGSSSWIALAAPAPIFDPEMRTFTFAHLAPGLFMPCGAMQAAGGSYQWLRDVICLPEKQAAAGLGISPYELMNLQAEASPPGARGLLFLPYLLGERSPRWNPDARGAYIGLTVQHNRAEIVRATLEGISFNLRAIWSVPGTGRPPGGDACNRRRRPRSRLAPGPGRHLRPACPAPGLAGGGYLARRSPGRRYRRGAVQRLQPGRNPQPDRGHRPPQPGEKNISHMDLFDLGLRTPPALVDCETV
jgi:xylulokinase